MERACENSCVSRYYVAMYVLSSSTINEMFEILNLFLKKNANVNFEITLVQNVNSEHCQW